MTHDNSLFLTNEFIKYDRSLSQGYALSKVGHHSWVDHRPSHLLYWLCMRGCGGLGTLL